MDRGAWQAMEHRVTQSQASLKRLKTQHAHQDRNSPGWGPAFPQTSQRHPWSFPACAQAWPSSVRAAKAQPATFP